MLSTWYAVVADLEVSLEVLGTLVDVVECGVREADLTATCPGAHGVHVDVHVHGAAHVAVVVQDAAPELHAAVERSADHDDLAGGAGRRERLGLAVVT